MFRTLARVSGPFALFSLHPADLTALLEIAWDNRFDLASHSFGSPFRRSPLSRFSNTLYGSRLQGAGGAYSPLTATILATLVVRRHNTVLWDHLIYAYLIENTRIYEVFRQVVHELTHGEKLGAPSPQTQQWLRSTEELLYKAPPPLFVSAVNSDIRPDAAATRRTTYFRMFGMDLNHGAADNKPYPFVRPEAVNKEFASTFEEFLREVWVGMINASNSSGTKATDDAKLGDLLEKLQNMLLSRRTNGVMSREEFAAVSLMSWFHLTVDSNTPVVNDLRAQAASAEQRLYKIAQQVGVPAHGLSNSYFEIADSVSVLLILIEAGLFAAVPGAVTALYTPGGQAERTMRTIITHWSIITGRDIKGSKLAPSEGLRRAS